MAISAQTLFHFTKFQHLKSIIQAKAFSPRLSFETFINDNDTIVAYPMVCFCDIPLSQIYPHAIEYQRNGIGLNKDWGIQKGLNPVFYLQKESYPTKIIKDATFAILNKNRPAVNNKIAIETNNPALLRYFFDLTAFYKPRIGKIWDKENNRFVKYSGISKEDKIINFYDEREWRYVPNLQRSDTSNKVPVNFWMKEDFYNNKSGVFQKNTFEDINKQFQEYTLDFSVDNIKYIIVSRVTDLGHLATYISNLNNYSKQEKSVLTSKIISLKQIHEDF